MQFSLIRSCGDRSPYNITEVKNETTYTINLRIASCPTGTTKSIAIPGNAVISIMKKFLNLLKIVSSPTYFPVKNSLC